MKDPIATCILWCRSGETLTEFEITLGMPYQKDNRWCCDWSLGCLDKLGSASLDGGKPGESFTSMHAMFFAQGAILRALEFRENLGSLFYTDALEEDLIEDLRAFFPSLQRRRPEKKLCNRTK